MAESSIFSKPVHVLLLAGGPSAEREVSLAGGVAVEEALRSRGHRVTRFDPISGHLHGIIAAEYDVAFIALHGVFGEDGQVQQILEHLGLPYTGSGPEASRVAMSKSATKERLIEAGLPTPAHVLIFETDTADELRQKASVVGYPLVIKPDAQGSSLGVTIVHAPEHLAAALNRCFHYGSMGLMEAAIVGEEWTVGVLDELALPPLRVVATSEFYDYEAKYFSDSTLYLFASQTADLAIHELERLARTACDRLGTSGIARVDFRLDRFRRPWILEINTIPGFTSHSLVPKAAERLGISFAELCERALRAALVRGALTSSGSQAA